jgi:gluconokinase
MPYLLGERAPIWDSEASGAFWNSEFPPSPFYRAVVEGISMACIVLQPPWSQLDCQLNACVSGGFVQSEEWLQIWRIF